MVRCLALLVVCAEGRPHLEICGGAKHLEDFDGLFNSPSSWPRLRERLDSVKFFLGDVATIPSNVSGSYPAVAAMFKETGLVLDFEAGGLRPFNCNGTDYALKTFESLRPLLREPDLADARVRVTFDGPFAHSLHQPAGGKLCQLTDQGVARELLKHCETLRASIAELQPHMQVSFGWNEPVPWYHVGSYPPFRNGTVKDFGDLLDLVDLVVGAGVPVAFFHADSPPSYAEDYGYDKLGLLMRHVRSKGLRFGKYFNSQTGGATSDLDFERGTVKDAQDFVAANGAPDDVIVESWYEYPRHAFPDTLEGALAHTTLVVASVVDGGELVV